MLLGFNYVFYLTPYFSIYFLSNFMHICLTGFPVKVASLSVVKGEFPPCGIN